MHAMDPHDVLGVRPGAGPEEIARAYRDLAKRFHPDRRPDDVAAELMMREVNAAYTALSGSRRAHGRGRHDRHRPPRGGPAQGRPAETQPHPDDGRRRGEWLEPTLRAALGSELLAALEDEEPVCVVTDAAMSDAFDVRLAVSDRRLLWLRDDAATDRVRTLRFAAIERIEGRLKGRLRPTGRLHVHPRDGRRITFAELEPGALRSVLLATRRAVPA
jgi:curved DNA-binding protein CbpA